MIEMAVVGRQKTFRQQMSPEETRMDINLDEPNANLKNTLGVKVDML